MKGRAGAERSLERYEGLHDGLNTCPNPTQLRGNEHETLTENWREQVSGEVSRQRGQHLETDSTWARGK